MRDASLKPLDFRNNREKLNRKWLGFGADLTVAEMTALRQ
jgi:hypothetical protein